MKFRLSKDTTENHLTSLSSYFTAVALLRPVSSNNNASEFKFDLHIEVRLSKHHSPEHVPEQQMKGKKEWEDLQMNHPSSCDDSWFCLEYIALI